MLINMYAVFDSAAKTFNNPLYAANHETAKRMFADAVNDDDSLLSRHPQHFTLFHVGVYDTDNAQIATPATPESLGLAVEFVREHDAPTNPVLPFTPVNLAELTPEQIQQARQTNANHYDSYDEKEN